MNKRSLIKDAGFQRIHIDSRIVTIKIERLIYEAKFEGCVRYGYELIGMAIN